MYIIVIQIVTSCISIHRGFLWIHPESRSQWHPSCTRQMICVHGGHGRRRAREKLCISNSYIYGLWYLVLVPHYTTHIFVWACQDTSMPDSQALKTEEDWLSLGGLNTFPGMSRSDSNLKSFELLSSFELLRSCLQQHAMLSQETSESCSFRSLRRLKRK